ncbi:MAG: hypothetical protein IE885_01255 [Campylobacterales bacterium]|nr:hypothetical protein [Campylobacterales bacterium]
MNTKETLLQEIESLMAYGKQEPTINPSLLAYLEIKDLEHIKQRLLEKVNKLNTEDKEWLKQFKKEN